MARSGRLIPIVDSVIEKGASAWRRLVGTPRSALQDEQVRQTIEGIRPPGACFDGLYPPTTRCCDMDALQPVPKRRKGAEGSRVRLSTFCPPNEPKLVSSQDRLCECLLNSTCSVLTHHRPSVIDPSSVQGASRPVVESPHAP